MVAGIDSNLGGLPPCSVGRSVGQRDSDCSVVGEIAVARSVVVVVVVWSVVVVFAH